MTKRKTIARITPDGIRESFLLNVTLAAFDRILLLLVAAFLILHDCTVRGSMQVGMANTTVSFDDKDAAEKRRKVELSKFARLGTARLGANNRWLAYG